MWLEKKYQLLKKEAEQLKHSHPSLKLSVHDDGSATIKGYLEVEKDISYSIILYLPKKYPKEEPKLICNKAEIPWTFDRHVYQNGCACLCTPSETRIHWPRGSNIVEFIDKLVLPFLVWQNYYESYGEAPPSGERSHGKPGIIEAYKDILSSLENITEDKISRFIKLLARKKEPAGHELCPCLSGKKLRNCHSTLMKNLRETIDYKHALQDMNELCRS